MTVSANKLRLVAFALIALAGGAFAAENASSSAKDARQPPAKKEAEAKSGQKSAIEQLKDQARQFSKDHDALLKELSEANEEKRKEILQKMEERKKEFEEKLSALHKEMRDEQRKQRQSGAPKKR